MGQPGTHAGGPPSPDGNGLPGKDLRLRRRALDAGSTSDQHRLGYDPAADAWDELANMPVRRFAGSAVSMGNYIYIVGGRAPRDLLRYDPAADAWTSLAPLAQLREHIAAVALDGKIYALAGRLHGVGELDSVEIYDPATDQWSPGVPLIPLAAGMLRQS
jgi:N-acetylneuraminic acid mutarotase